jgi:hypothetical protein
MDWLKLDRRNIAPICISTLICLMFANTATAQVSSGLNSAEGAQITACDGISGCGTTPTDTLWADSMIERWRMMNHTTSSSGSWIVAQWVCVHPGCIPYSATTATNSVYTETELLIGLQGTILTSTGSIPAWSSGPVLGLNTMTTGTLGLANGNPSGTTVTLQNNSATTAYSFNLPSGAGSSGQPLLSGGGLTAPMTFGTLSVGAGGTAQTSLTAHGVLIGEGTSAITPLTAAAAGTLLTGQGSSSDPSFGASPTLGVNATTAGTLGLANGNGGGKTATIQNTAATIANYNFNLPSSAGSSGQPLLSGGGLTAPMTYGSITGTTTIFATANSNLTSSASGDLVTVDTNGNVQDSGMTPCLIQNANAGFLIPPYIFFPSSNGASVVVETGSSANTVKFIQFYLPCKATLNHVSINITTNSTSQSVVLGFYSCGQSACTSSSPLVSGSSVSLSCASANVVTGSTGSTLTLEPGIYAFAYGATDTSCAVTSQGIVTWMSSLNQNSSKRQGTGANAISSGALPSTLGTLSTSNQNIPYSLWEP